jgi:twitching motility protein PilT
MEMIDLLQMVTERKGSDLILAVGVPPVIRINQELIQTDLDPLTPREAERLIYSILTEDQVKRFKADWELDFSYSVPGLSRFRTNVHRQRGSVAAAIRPIPDQIPGTQDLNLPDIVKRLCDLQQGLVLVTGPAGSGKSTTMARMIETINTQRSSHIITIEDPIEFLFKHRRSVIEQRELHLDTHSFSDALKYTLRQDPDVIMIGEARDQETIEAALAAAETGHLVFATLHTNSATQTIERIIDIFPSHAQQQIRIQLANILEGVISQQLVARSDQKGVILAAEVLIGTSAVRNLIRERNTHQIAALIQIGAKYGMQSFEQAFLSLHRKHLITKDTLLSKLQRKEFDQTQEGEL